MAEVYDRDVIVKDVGVLSARALICVKRIGRIETLYELQHEIPNTRTPGLRYVLDTIYEGGKHQTVWTAEEARSLFPEAKI